MRCDTSLAIAGDSVLDAAIVVVMDAYTSIGSSRVRQFPCSDQDTNMYRLQTAICRTEAEDGGKKTCSDVDGRGVACFIDRRTYAKRGEQSHSAIPTQRCPSIRATYLSCSKTHPPIRPSTHPSSPGPIIPKHILCDTAY